MAQKEVFRLGENCEEVISVVNGPNDWDLWLCMRGTIREVSFDVDRPISIPPFTDPSTAFSGRIMSISLAKKYSYEKVWNIEGEVWKGIHGLFFSMNYDSNSRRGFAKFKRL